MSIDASHSQHFEAYITSTMDLWPTTTIQCPTAVGSTCTVYCSINNAPCEAASLPILTIFTGAVTFESLVAPTTSYRSTDPGAGVNVVNNMGCIAGCRETVMCGGPDQLCYVSCTERMSSWGCNLPYGTIDGHNAALLDITVAGHYALHKMNIIGPTGGTLRLSCTDYNCQNINVDAYQSTALELTVSGVQHGAVSVTGPLNGNATVTCEGHEFCKSFVVNTSHSQHLAVHVDEITALSGSDVHCPTSVGSSCTIYCHFSDVSCEQAEFDSAGTSVVGTIAFVAVV